MANFPPFKKYTISVLDELIKKYHIQGPFLDAGCGIGDVSLHLAQNGWHGDSIDITSSSVELTSKLLHPFPQVSVKQTSIEDAPNNKYNLILLLDVLEHIPDDSTTLNTAAKMGLPGSYILITVPSNPESEWRWDDEVYGHLRRYNPKVLENLLSESGFQVIEMWDISYPVFWLLRRAFTSLKRKPTLSGYPQKRTQQSPFTNAWDLGLLSDLISNPTYWRPLYWLQRRYRDRLEKGHEIAILAQRI